MKLTFGGTRGSIGSAGWETVAYGGDTSSVQLETANGSQLILDAGSGIRRLGARIDRPDRVDILLSHLHMDHVQGLPFFGPLLDPKSEVHIWGPISTDQGLKERLSRYLSPPLFPIHVRDLPNTTLHDLYPGSFEIGGLEITADLVSHPGSTLGYRIVEKESVLTYIPDHEPALGSRGFPESPEWTSGFDLAANADVLIHDAQYTDEEYEARIGWGHTSVSQLAAFASTTRCANLVTFHHDPAHDDQILDEMTATLRHALPDIEVISGKTGTTIEV